MMPASTVTQPGTASQMYVKRDYREYGGRETLPKLAIRDVVAVSRGQTP